MNRYIPIGVLMLAVALSGCTAALSGVGGTLMGLAGTAGVSAAERKIEARVKWGTTRSDLVAVIRNGMSAQAQLRLMAGNYACWRQIMDDVLAFHEREKPLFIVEKVIAKRAEPIEPTELPKPRKDCGEALTTAEP